MDKFKEFKKAVRESEKNKGIILISGLSVLWDTVSEVEKNLYYLAKNWSWKILLFSKELKLKNTVCGLRIRYTSFFR